MIVVLTYYIAQANKNGSYQPKQKFEVSPIQSNLIQKPRNLVRQYQKNV